MQPDYAVRTQLAADQTCHSRFHAKLRSDQSTNVRRIGRGSTHSSSTVLEHSTSGLRELGRSGDNGIF